MGILLKEFSTHTVASDWKTKVMAVSEEITHKVAKVKNFSLFLDYDLDHRSKIDMDRLLKDSTNGSFKDILTQEFTHKEP
jgi:hypothetical protein